MLRLSQERHRDLKGIGVGTVLHDQLVPKLLAGEAGRVEVVYQWHRHLAVEPPGDVLGEGRERRYPIPALWWLLLLSRRARLLVTLIRTLT